MQLALIFILLYILPCEFSKSLSWIFKQQSTENHCPKEPAPYSDLNHIMRYRTRKHKRQELVIRKNWKDNLKRFSNLLKRLSNCSKWEDKRHRKKDNSVKSGRKGQISTFPRRAIHFLVYIMSVVLLPGLCLMYILTPRIETFSKLMYNLPDS